MRVRAIRSFVSRVGGRTYRLGVGDEMGLPDGADWLKAGLVAPVKASRQETAVRPRPADVRARTVAQVPGIGAEMGAELNALGILTARELLAADVATLTGIKGVGRATARKWQAAAEALLNNE